MKAMEDSGRSYIALATTNKAARIINGKTIHMFAASCTSKYLKELKTESTQWDCEFKKGGAILGVSDGNCFLETNAIISTVEKAKRVL